MPNGGAIYCQKYMLSTY
ncbi:MAG TPA: hypothetical protein DEB31_04990 [Clostridiales bacterium]|nr:hypothetical protein [Clostridiales bacterium]